jgi:DNA repair protein RadC
MLRDRVIAAELLREKEQIWEDHAAEVRHFHVRVTEMANEAEQLRTAIRVAKTESNTLRIENMWLRKRLDFIGKVLGANPTISRTASKGVLPHPFTIVVIDRKGDELISSGGESALEAWNQMKAPIHEATFIREMEDENREGLLELDLVETLQRLSPGEARSASAKSSEPTPPPPPPPPPPPSLEGVGLPACALGGLTEGQLRLFDDLGLPACSRGDRNSPCEIMKREGIGALREEDILSVLLDIEPPEAARIIREAGGLIGLAKAPLGRLLNMEGVTLELALRIKSAGEFCMRMERADFPSGVQVRTPEDLKPFLKTFRTRDRESFWVILMDAKNQVFDVREVCTGTVDACSLHPRDIFSPVIIEGATAFIIVHNHPSGQPSASPEDAMLSVRVRDAAKGLGLRMLDSLIVAGNEIVSLRAEGLI